MSSAACCAPRWLKEARDQVERGTLSAAEFKRIEDRAVDEAVPCRRRPASTWSPTARCGATRSSATSSTRVEGFDKEGGWSIPFRDERGPAASLRASGRRRQAALAAADVRRGVHLPARPHDAAGQGHADQRAAGRRLLRSRASRRAPTRRATPTWPTWWTSRGARSRSWRASAATTSRSTRRSTRRCSTRRSARATASAAAIPTGCSTPASSWTMRSSTAIPASPSASTSAAATTRACSTRPAATTRSRAVFRRARFQRFLLEYDDERSGGVRAAAPRAGRPHGGARARQLEAADARIGGRPRAPRSPRLALSCRWNGWRSARSAASPRPTKAIA